MTRCKCCNQPMQADKQVSLTGKPIVLLTCFNPQCRMHGYTFDSRDYADENIDSYKTNNPNKRYRTT